MSWVVIIDWDGKRERFEDVVPEIVEDTDALSLNPNYVPRRFTFELPLGDALAFWAQGHDPTSMKVAVFYNGRPMSTAPVVEFQAGRAGQMSRITVADEPNTDATTIPPKYDMRMKILDAEASAREEQRFQEYLDLLYAAAGGDYEAELELLARGWDLPGFGVRHEGGALGDIDIHVQTWDTNVYAVRTEGQIYQLVFGRPGADGTPAVRGYMVDDTTDTILVAGHQITNGTVTVHAIDNDGARFSRVLSTATSQDQRGRAVTVCDVSDLIQLDGGKTPNAGNGTEWTWLVAFDGTAAGLPANPADVLAYMLAVTPGMRVLGATVVSLRDQLAGMTLGRVVDAEASAWPSVEAELLPMLPVCMVPGPYGAELRFVNLRPQPGDHVYDVEEGPTLAFAEERVPLLVNPSDIVNQWRVRYSLRKENGRYARQVTAGPGTHSLATASATVYGLQEDTYDASWVSDQATAHVVAHTLLDKTAAQRLQAEFLALPSAFGLEGTHPLEAAMVVRLTSTSLGVDQALALVSRVRRQGSLLRVTFVVLDPRYA